MSQRQLVALNIALVVEFFLGVFLTTVINFDPSKHDTVQTIFLIAHIVVGIGLVIGGSVRLVVSIRQRLLRVVSGIGLISMVGALVSGSEAARTGSSVAVLIMATLFMVALVSYGYSMVVVTRLTHNKA